MAKSQPSTTGRFATSPSAALRLRQGDSSPGQAAGKLFRVASPGDRVDDVGGNMGVDRKASAPWLAQSCRGRPDRRVISKEVVPAAYWRP
jgi:hypothetical protein